MVAHRPNTFRVSGTKPQTFGRRKVLAGGAIAAGAWVTPSVLGFDRVAAAEGSCGVAPVQVDWSAFTDTFPTSVTANDGTVVTISVADPFGVGDPTFLGRVFNGDLSSRDDPLLMAMENATNGQFTEIEFSFSNPVQLCFELIDVDRGEGSWEDTMELIGSLGGAPVTVTAADVVTAATNTVSGPNTILGTSPAAAAATTGNATVNYPSVIDNFVIRHRDDSTFPGFQYIGIHDLRWC